jgi:RimJ/RimL family protein N-acetyltransferase
MIQGKKIQLRAIEPKDTELYFEWINDAETNQWRGLHHPTSKAESQAWIQEQMESRADRLTFAIEIAADEKNKALIGFVGLRGICSRSRRAELWIYIGDKKRWGAHHGQDCIATLCRYAFDEMNLFRIWMECDPAFLAAVKCYEKVGFVKEGTLRKAYYRRGEYRDTCMMGLLRPDFQVSSKES